MLVEKVSYNVNWQKFKPGYSIFIPCLDTKQARREVLKVTNRLGFKVLMKGRIEDGVRGLRIWRM